MKILCVCAKGNKRSVFIRYLLENKYDALAMGVEDNTPETIRMLAGWADVILCAEPWMKKSIPVKYQKKVDLRFELGPDIFPVSIGGILLLTIRARLKKLEYI